MLPRMLDENPAERPTSLLELVEQLRGVPAANREASEVPSRWKRRVLLALAGAAVLIASVAGYFAFTPGPASSAADDATISPSSASSAADDFDAAFSPSGIYDEPRR